MWKFLDIAIPVSVYAIALLGALAFVEYEHVQTVGWAALIAFLAGRGYQILRMHIARKITQ
ncbi:hypothetical protein B2J88_35355 [Rhodococcus sp. SRB_17]|uniref:hypothetical protein n=1 Tax=Acidovorax sp. SRB_24 TaxID=1962700 RepID=UPI00145CBADA|nr:hypothetical protein [Acidovorax sp. SRB_24]NMM78319.1 hypothetical protein [Acidovorax sp. SRB_24]NMM89562.1 hypothetical protein [Rhodococcus sp. SRB_17]